MLVKGADGQVTRSMNLWLNSSPDALLEQLAEIEIELDSGNPAPTPTSPPPPPPRRSRSRENNPRMSQMQEELEEGEIAPEEEFAFSPGPIDSPFKKQKPANSGIPRRGGSKTPMQLSNSFEELDAEDANDNNVSNQQAPTQWGPTPSPKPRPTRFTSSAERGPRTRSPPPPSWPRDGPSPSERPRDGGKGAWRRDDWGVMGRDGSGGRDNSGGRGRGKGKANFVNRGGYKGGW